MTELNSTALIRAVQNRDGSITVTFSGGGTATYADVPGHVFNELVTAESAGRYFNINIRGSYAEI